jgi:hypothetical protein
MQIGGLEIINLHVMSSHLTLQFLTYYKKKRMQCLQA